MGTIKGKLQRIIIILFCETSDCRIKSLLYMISGSGPGSSFNIPKTTFPEIFWKNCKCSVWMKTMETIWRRSGASLKMSETPRWVVHRRHVPKRGVPNVWSLQSCKGADGELSIRSIDFFIAQSSVVDTHWCNADPDMEPAFSLIAYPDPDPGLNADTDPDPDSDPGCWWPNSGKNAQL